MSQNSNNVVVIIIIFSTAAIMNAVILCYASGLWTISYRFFVHTQQYTIT